jgi:FlaA1/EpsC-like NDP-sugar epimerase
MFPLETLDTVGLRNFRVGSLKVTIRAIQALVEISILVGAFVFAYLLRFDFSIPSSEVTKILVQLPLVVALQVIALRAFGAHRFIWRYTSAQDAASIAKALGSVLLLLLVLDRYILFYRRSLLCRSR